MKRIICTIMMLVVCFSFAGCVESEEALNSNINALKTEISVLEDEISQLESEKNSLQEEITVHKVATGTAKYIVTFRISQKHLTLDLGNILKDAMNDISIQIPVDKEYYDSVEIGDIIDDSFRLGPFVFKGSFGSWNIAVENKEVK